MFRVYVMQRCNPVKLSYRKTSKSEDLSPLVVQGCPSSWETWKYLDFLLHREKHLAWRIQFWVKYPWKNIFCWKKIIYSQNWFLFEKKLFEVSGSQNLPLKFKSLKKLALRWVADSLNVSLPKCEHQSDSVLLVIKLNRDIW